MTKDPIAANRDAPALSKPFVGGFAIVRGAYSWSLYEVEKVTAKQFKGSDVNYSSLLSTVGNDGCVFCGSKSQAKSLYERLVSSEALCDDERRKAVDRKHERNAALIAAAQSEFAQ